MRSLFVDLAQVFVPKLCLGCRRSLPTSLPQLCLECLEKLPETHYEQFPDNPLYRLINKRVAVAEATSLYFFEKEGLLQKLIHLLKYKGQYKIGVFFGQILGGKMATSKRVTYSLVVPVPLHKKRQRKRGYNQVVGFAKALAQHLNIPYSDKLLIRHKPTKTLVQMTQTERWTQVHDAFEVRNTNTLKGHHVLLVDDVVTTGATLSAVVQCMTACEGVLVSVAAIGFAQSPLP